MHIFIIFSFTDLVIIVVFIKLCFVFSAFTFKFRKSQEV